jgi:beta-glucosidase/6-phospho-beta-glucosidase/beta-galactosidase
MDKMTATTEHLDESVIAATDTEAQPRFRRLQASIVERAHALPLPRLRQSRLFKSVLMGGFECATHRQKGRRTRLDLQEATGHAHWPAEDYRALGRYGIRSARDGLRWHLIEQTPGHYDWSSFLPLLHAARDTGTQVIWDLCHYGWPDHLDIWGPDFIDRFAAFSAAAARLVRQETDGTAHYIPINEISFWAWAGGSKGFMNPHGHNRGSAFKTLLIRAALAAIDAIRATDPGARIIAAEPAIHVAPRTGTAPHRRVARGHTNAQFEAMDALTGRARPELGGHVDNIDIVGLNFYADNQWIHSGLPLPLDDVRYWPLRDMLRTVHERYDKPVFLSETGIEGNLRAAWLRVIATEVAAAQAAGIPVEGLCLYPVTDYLGWSNKRYCSTGLFGFPDAQGNRPVFGPLAREIGLLNKAMLPPG